MNIDDKCKDHLTVSLPEVQWTEFETPLWEKWKEEIKKNDDQYTMKIQEKAAAKELVRIMRKKWHNGEITEEDYYDFKEKMDI